MLECFFDCFHTTEKRGHHDRGLVLFRNSEVPQLELWQQPRRHEHRYQLIDDADTDFTRRDQREQGDHYTYARRDAFHCLENSADSDSREKAYAAKVNRVGMALCPAVYPFTRWGRVSDSPLENSPPLVD